jgi:prepilin-type N-terminal cleavage/methylation domain-containing protein
MRNDNGFTLVEVMVVATIIGIITAIGLPYYSSYKKTACDQTAQAELYNIKAAVQNYLTRSGDPEMTETTALTNLTPSGDATYGWAHDPGTCNVTVTFSGSVVTTRAEKGTGAAWSLDMAGGGEGTTTSGSDSGTSGGNTTGGNTSSGDNNNPENKGKGKGLTDEYGKGNN